MDAILIVVPRQCSFARYQFDLEVVPGNAPPSLSSWAEARFEVSATGLLESYKIITGTFEVNADVLQLNM